MSAVDAVSPSRRTAFEILMNVGRGKAHSDELLRGKAVEALSAVDRNLTTTLVLGVLRWQIRLDHHIKNLLKKPNAKLDPEVLTALRLGAFQLLFLARVPAHAAIDESVELTKQSGHRFASGMVNAVLRRLTHAESQSFEALTESPDDFALAQGHPAWMVERWVSFYGPDGARTICLHGQEEPTLSIRIGNADVEGELARAGIRLEHGKLLTGARTVVSGNVSATEAFQEGRARIQDEGSQLIGELAACVGDAFDRNTQNIIDTCAAPGGKTLILAERNPETRIVACEASPRRLAELRKRLAAHAAHVECRPGDAAALNEDSIFDVALADVPCSGTGTLGRNPEIRHRLRHEDLARHAERQKTILRAALKAVRPGGQVIYSTCSLEPEENEEVVASVLAESRNARQVSFTQCIAKLLKKGVVSSEAAEWLQQQLTAEGALRILPGMAGTDGYFVALLEKIA